LAARESERGMSSIVKPLVRVISVRLLYLYGGREDFLSILGMLLYSIFCPVPKYLAR
jgi:hypothetical protein